MTIRTMLKALCIVTALGVLGVIGAYSLGKYGIYETPQKSTRLTCEDLGRCNLQTGEVYDLEAIEAAKKYATLFEQ